MLEYFVVVNYGEKAILALNVTVMSDRALNDIYNDMECLVRTTKFMEGR